VEALRAKFGEAAVGPGRGLGGTPRKAKER
jgi:hypothetical protein